MGFFLLKGLNKHFHLLPVMPLTNRGVIYEQFRAYGKQNYTHLPAVLFWLLCYYGSSDTVLSTAMKSKGKGRKPCCLTKKAIVHSLSAVWWRPFSVAGRIVLHQHIQGNLYGVVTLQQPIWVNLFEGGLQMEQENNKWFYLSVLNPCLMGAGGLEPEKNSQGEPKPGWEWLL